MLPVQLPRSAGGHIPRDQCRARDHAFRESEKAKRIPTTNAPPRTNANAIRSPSKSALDRPRPLIHAMIQPTTNWAAAIIPAESASRERRRSASRTNSTLHSTIAATCPTTPATTVPAPADRPNKTPPIAANGRLALPRRWPMATSAPVVAAVATLPTTALEKNGCARTPQSKRAAAARSSGLATIRAANVTTEFSSFPKHNALAGRASNGIFSA